MIWICLISCKFNKDFRQLLLFDDNICYNKQMRIVNLSSGSDGNITYIESDFVKILLDDGLSCSESVKRLETIGVSPKDINAILVTHEHSDHIKGIDLFSKKFDVPVYAHSDVWKGLDGKLTKVEEKNRRQFDGKFEFKDLLISPVEVPHDVKCYGFSFSVREKKISVVTDIGHFNDRVINEIKGSQIAYIEANYDRDMLFNGTKYPLSLKRRIAGPNGHLSNNDCGDAIDFLALHGAKQIVLSHLSKENNTPLLAYNSVCNRLKNDGIIEGRDIRIDVATTQIGAIFRLK